MIQRVTPSIISSVSNTSISGSITGAQLASGAAVTNLGYTPPNSSSPFISNILTQYAVGTSVPFTMRGGYRNAPGSSWYTVDTFAEYAFTGFLLLVGYEDNNGDGANRFAIFVDSGSGSYGGGFGVTRLHGSTSLECQRAGGVDARTLQVRHNAGGTSGAVHLQWQYFKLDITGG